MLNFNIFQTLSDTRGSLLHRIRFLLLVCADLPFPHEGLTVCGKNASV